MNKKLVSTLGCLLTLTACASINSSYLHEASDDGGLNYYMPNKDLVLTVTVVDWAKLNAGNEMKYLQEEVAALIERRVMEPNAGVRSRITTIITNRQQAIANANNVLSRPDNLSISNIEATTGAAYPDLSKTFSLEYGKNGLGKNTLDISISKTGLLSSTKSKTESQLSEALVNLARSAGASSARKSLNRIAAAGNDHCPHRGKFSFSFDMTVQNPPQFTCVDPIDVTIRPHNSGNAPHRNGPELDKNTKTTSGVYYRQQLPYAVSISYGAANDLKKIVYSPTGSQTHLLPIKHSLFADSDAKFTLVDGIPTQYKQESGGEVVSLLKIPADLISAYFGAVGEIFDKVSGSDTSEVKAINAEIQLLLAQQKITACRDAIEAKDAEAIESLKCVGDD